MDIGYANEKFYLAMRSLICDGSLADRLEKVFGYLSTVREADLPDEDRLRERFSALMSKLEMLAVPREKPLSMDEILELTIAKEQAEDLAQEILSIFDDLARRSE